MNIIPWIVNSSKDPRYLSLTIKGALVFLIPIVLQLLSVTCLLGVLCLVNVTNDTLTTLTDQIVHVTETAAIFVGTVLTVVGFVRKLVVTAKDENPTKIAP